MEVYGHNAATIYQGGGSFKSEKERVRDLRNGLDQLSILRTKSLDDLSSIVFVINNLIKSLNSLVTKYQKVPVQDKDIDMKEVINGVVAPLKVLKELLDKVRAYFLKKMLKTQNPKPIKF